MTVPPIIHSLWLQGEADWPDLVRVCFARWADLNPHHELRVLDRAAAECLLAEDDLPVASLSPQALSDVVRAKLLLTEGGVWADATVLPTRPLDVWLPALVDATGFFAFAQPGPDRPLSSWFLASSPRHIVLDRWWQETRRFWSLPRGNVSVAIPADPVAAVAPETAGIESYPYYWFHYLFAYLIDRDADVARAWAQCPRVAADAPHRLQLLFADSEHWALEEILAAQIGSPVHKLNRRADYPLELLTGLPEAARRQRPKAHTLRARVFRRRDGM